MVESPFTTFLLEQANIIYIFLVCFVAFHATFGFRKSGVWLLRQIGGRAFEDEIHTDNELREIPDVTRTSKVTEILSFFFLFVCFFFFSILISP